MLETKKTHGMQIPHHYTVTKEDERYCKTRNSQRKVSLSILLLRVSPDFKNAQLVVVQPTTTKVGLALIGTAAGVTMTFPARHACVCNVSKSNRVLIEYFLLRIVFHILT